MNTHQLSILAKDRLIEGKRFFYGFFAVAGVFATFDCTRQTR